jgi:hypothetical protein
MRIFKRRRLEHVSQLGQYPEPWPMSNHPRLAFWYRYLLGRPMDNIRWTDATFWRDAHSGEASRWLRLAGWKRASFRVFVPHLLLLTGALILLALMGMWETFWTLVVAHVLLLMVVLAPPLLTRRVLAHGLTVLTPTRVRTADVEVSAHWEWCRRTLIEGRLQWERSKVLPLASALVPRLGLTHRAAHPHEARQWVSVPRNYREQNGKPVVISLPSSFSMEEAARKRLVNACAERLGMKEMLASWQLEGEHPQLLLSAPNPPPKLVRPADVARELAAAEEYTFVLGRTAGEVLTVSLKEDAPHLAVSAGSGAGKSELIKGMVAQALHWGWSALILDYKGESQEWAEGLPGVRYVRNVAGLHDAMVSIGEEIEHRRLMSKEERARCGRVLVVSEEWSITATLLKEYWDELRSMAEPEEKRTMPLRSPAITAGMKLNFAGRSLGFSQLMVAIRFSARVTNGNADLRESFSVKFLARYSPQTVKMLAPDVKPFPRRDNTPGRWVAVNGDVAVMYTGVLWSDEEAQEYAQGGQPSPASTFGRRMVDTVVPATIDATTTLDDLLPVAATTGSEEPLEVEAFDLDKLVDISATLAHYRVSERMLREWRDNDPAFPPKRGGSRNQGWLYDRGEVTDYVRRRRAAEAAEETVK